MKISKKNGIWGLVVLLVILAGVWLIFYSGQEQVKPETADAENSGKTKGKTARARLKSVTEWYEAVGSLRPRTETRIEAQIQAQVLQVTVRAGDRVEKDQTLVVLDNRQMDARLSQARQALKTAGSRKQQAEQSLNAAQAAFNEAESDYQRIRNYYESEAATEQELERSKARYLQTQAGLRRAGKAVQGAAAGVHQAEAAVREARVSSGYSRIKAPSDGEVIKRLIEPGDLALPGKPLVLMKTTENLQIEAFVREGLIGKVKPGTRLSAEIDVLDEPLRARVEEIVPYADPQTRTFLIKALLPPAEGLYPGMYGKLRIPRRVIQVVVIPPETIQKVGQLEMVDVRVDGRWQKRYVKTGKYYDGMVEILSGLSGNEILMIRESGNVRKQ